MLILFCLTGAATTIVISENIWLSCFWPLLLWLIYMNGGAQPNIRRLAFEAGYFAFWDTSDEKQEFHWQGEGRISSLFLSFQLHNEAGEKLKLVIWRDSLSDASWRAMNMAFRVAQPSLRNQSSGNEGAAL